MTIQKTHPFQRYVVHHVQPRVHHSAPHTAAPHAATQHAAAPKAAAAARTSSASPPPSHNLNDKAKALVASDPVMQKMVAAAAPKLDGKKVLMIGDSHTEGQFGSRFDALLRASGAQTHSVAQSNSSPDWWVSGRSGHWGGIDRSAAGAAKPWETGATPTLSSLMQGKDKPDVLVVAMGANFRGRDTKSIQSEVNALADQAQKAGVKLVWVGPPNKREDIGHPQAIDKFNQQMTQAIGNKGTYIPSSQFTPVYAGGDGEHYTGERGQALANNWAERSFQAFTNGL
jgi:hypothetical protein